ncbi:uncharacterized protein LOC126281969 [Schistocerca gregaria]|uniref:uncharacterized protein LOC126281969 n=1 Tax=Schistocerca gregaria TaxID=7010 RepID=UPI00211E0FB3|nr:uncharacterized protein LOC126281969 [Schistocerca gregaria]
MHVLRWVTFTTTAVVLSLTVGPAASNERRLSRHRRYAVFPEGSTWSIAWCLSVQALTGEYSIYTEGFAWAAAYELPNSTFVEQTYLKKKKNKYLLPAPGIFRRHRRDLYKTMEKVIESAGIDGHSCVLRALCEAAQRFVPGENTIGEEIVSTIFRWPGARTASWEPEEHHAYELAQRRGRSTDAVDCTLLYPACPLSLVDVLLYGHMGD